MFPSLLEQEGQIYRSLSGVPGFPQMYWDGTKDDSRVLIFEPLGSNLEDLHVLCGHHFSLKTTLLIATQLLSRFETLHSRGYLHRDVKPEKFFMGVGKRQDTIYMTGLGLSTRCPPQLSRSRDVSARPHLVDTSRYASINGHSGAGMQDLPSELKPFFSQHLQSIRPVTTLKHWVICCCTLCKVLCRGRK